jgi:hypothetical protein
MSTQQTAHELITARNRAASLCTRILALANDMNVAATAATLRKAEGLTQSLAGVPMDDSEAVAMTALVAAATNLAAAAQAHGPTITRPTNWRTELPAVNVALRELNL